MRRASWSVVAGIAVVAVLLLLINFLNHFVYQRLDLTQDQLYTLSTGSKTILSKLDAPVTIKFYFRQDLPKVRGTVQAHARRVEALLREYEIAGKGKVVVKKVNPCPDTDAEDAARMDGIEGIPVEGGEAFYLGLAISRADLNEVLPFLAPEKADTLEYEVTRAVFRVTHPDKIKVGVLSTLPVMGAGAPSMMEQEPPKDWFIIEALKQDYDVTAVTTNAESIPADVRVLLVIHPKALPERTLYAIDQFILKGGRVLAFLDPLSAYDMQNNPMARFRPQGPSTLGKLLPAWGISYEADKFAADMVNGFPQEGYKDLGVMRLQNESMNRGDVLTNGLKMVLMAYAGVFTGDAREGLQKTVLLKTSKRAQTVASMRAMQSAKAIFEDFQSEDKEFPVAVRLSGKFKTAYPDGAPPPEAKEGEENKEPPPPPPGPLLKEGEKETSVILVGDSDMLEDRIVAPMQRGPFGQIYRVMPFDNLILMLNAVEQLSGDSNLISIRSKSTTNRPFTKVDELETAANQQHLEKKKDLAKKVEEAQRRLDELRRGQSGENQKVVLSEEKKKEEEKLEADFKRLLLDLRQVDKDLRKDKDRLKTFLMAVNIGLMPALVVVAGLVVAFIRKRR